MPVESTDAVVVRAGPGGPGMSRELLERGIDHLVLEQGPIDETWRRQRCDAFALSSPAWMNRLPGEAAPELPDEFPSAPWFAPALERCAVRRCDRDGLVARGGARRLPCACGIGRGR